MLERAHQLKTHCEPISVVRPIWRGLGHLRDAGNRLTGGGLRSLAKRLVQKSLRGAMDQPLLKAIGRNLLQPLPSFSARLYRFATASDVAAANSTSLSSTPPATSRAEILLARVLRDACIIEIGPSYNPIAPKVEGWNTKTLDHTTRERLITKYQGQPGVDVRRIEEVGFIWTGEPLSDAVPTNPHGTFDAFIASDVIEHTPDLVAFLDAAGTLLKPEGTVVLVIPDKRYCFDYFQPLPTTGQVLAAHVESRSCHTPRIAFDHVAYAIKNGGVGAWGQHSVGDLSFFHLRPIEEASNLFRSVQVNKEFVDLHAWHFTPSSFELLLLELARLGETDWRIERITPASGCEFFAWLHRGGMTAANLLSPDQLAERRLALLKRTYWKSGNKLTGSWPARQNPFSLTRTAKTRDQFD
jgi:SAM-dependent methyltransferase